MSTANKWRSRKKLKTTIAVIVAQAAIQSLQDVLDPGLRRGDGFGTFYESVKVVTNAFGVVCIYK